METIPTTWQDARDGEFFRLTATTFSTSFTAGAGVLLASYDDERVRAEPTGDVVLLPLPAAVVAV